MKVDGIGMGWQHTVDVVEEIKGCPGLTPSVTRVWPS
jgi:hypothetical protein